MNKLPERQSIRLKGYDYSQPGFYFITICTQNRENLFGHIENKQMILNDAGKMVEKIWNEIPIFYPGIKIDEMCIMPNHFHGIIVLNSANIKKLSLSYVVNSFKTMTTKKYTDGVKQFNWQRFNKRLWQRNYWEYIVRNPDELSRIRQYIKYNPAKWEDDKLNGGIGNYIRENIALYGQEKWMV